VNYAIHRSSKRGTMLVVVLGLLVALFVIGTSFSFVTLSERKAAANYLDRQRALDLALDGVEYSIARLRAEATQKHYEPIGQSIAGLDDTGKEYDARRYALHPLEGKDPAVSWNKRDSKSSVAGSGDGNWVDFDGDNNRGGEETAFGTDKNELLVSKTITGFGGDGINNNQVRNENVERARDKLYGPSGTYEALGDYFRVRAVDAASLLNINNYREDRLRQVLMTLGDSIGRWLNNGKPSTKDNPLPKEVVDEFMIVAENAGWRFSSKEELRPIWQKFEGGDRMYEIAMNFITVNSWVDTGYRDYAASNTKIEEDPQANPLKLTEQEFWREGFCRTDTEGRDGWPDWQPAASSTSKAPVNINTATLPVLVCLFANLEAKARLLFFQKQDQITQNDQLIKDKFNQDVPAQISGTTDFGRQNNKGDVSGTGIQGEANWYPSGEDNRAIFQLVPIGPISTSIGDTGNTSSGGGGEDYATALAKEVMRLRTNAPFMSWQDFDARFFRGVLLGLNDNDRSQITVPDLIGVSRSNLNRNPQAVDGAYPKDLLPDAANCQHAANPIKSGDTAMTGSDFRAWYWKSCVDMLRAALCPSNLTARYNADYPMHMNVDRMDLTVTSSPICFSSMGIYEIVSQGEIMAPEVKGEQTTSSIPFDQRLPIARRQVRTTVQIYEVLRHSSQRDFASPVTAADINKKATSSGSVPEALCQLTKNHTKSGPYSIDEISSGTWQENDTDQDTYLAQLDDGKSIGYKKPVAGEVPGPNSPRDRVKGHNDYISASSDSGWVCMNPRDEAAWNQTRESNFPLTFHARFNESLNGRTKSSQFPNVKVDGVNSDQLARDEAWGHYPWEFDAAFEDFISTATPRSVEKATLGTGAAGSNEFVNSAGGEEATKYASLMSDGVFLRGGHLRQRAEVSLKGTFSIRGLVRYPRLKVLRYPCGSGGNAADARLNCFGPIRTTAAYGDPEMDDGVNDPTQVGYLDPGTTSSPGGQDENLMRMRLIGASPPFRGSDQHNEDAEFHRQHRSNVPYYQGTVDFWIKWDLPPQGANTTTADMVVALGEIDPASHNFSGLFGCTAYGRFKDSLLHSDPDSPPAGYERDEFADFEGVQFFVYKQPGGWLRFTRLYFMEAFGANIPSGATGTAPTSIVPFGKAMRRIFDVANPMGGYTATNDVCNDAGFGNDNLGFLYARTDSWLDLSQATWVGGAGLGKVIMRTHDWHRFTLSYNSNTEKPFLLWLDGRQVNGVAFFGDADINNPLGYRNDGRHAPLTDAAIPPDDPNGAEFDVYRTTTKILEINPEDRLTVGCITRRQVDLTQQQWYDEYFDNDPDQGDVDKPPRPVFKFDANFVAVANATIDDFRVTDQVLTDGLDLQPSEFQPYSRYMPANGKPTYYENGFLPVRDTDGELHALPVRLGTISWTELRPDWDPYRGRGMTLKTSAQIEMEWGVVDDYQSIKAGGTKVDLGQAKYHGASGAREGGGVADKDYWASGGMTLNNAVLPSGSRVGVLLYRAHFHASTDPNFALYSVNNVTPYLLDVTVTVLTPPRKITFVIEY
jgi:Tfp pilus assembly protein PilX